MMKNDDVDVSIIIVNYFSLSDIKLCIKSIVEKTSTDINFEIIICSNSPENQTEIDHIKSLFKSIKYFELPSNLGFAKANNQGATKARGKYIFFLNPDTEFINNALGELLDISNSHSRIGLIGPALYDENYEPFASVRSHISSLNLISLALPFGSFLFGKRSYNPFVVNETTYVDVVQGSALFISSRLFKDIGMMNEQYFMYSEERDLCYKLQKINRKVLFTTKAKVRHIGGTSTSPFFLKMEIEKQISLKKYITEHHPNLLQLYRFCYICGYFWRTIGSLLIINKKKMQQFSTILNWYLFKWNN